MKKFLIYYCLLVTVVVALGGFLSARGLNEVASAILFYPIVIYFISQTIPERKKTVVNLEKLAPIKLKLEGEEKIYISDSNKRAFIKLIGSAGLSLFFFALFTKKAQAAFFGSGGGPGIVALKDTSGTTIDPAKHHPTDGYKINQVDDSSFPAYYGFTEKNGAWYILREDSSGNYRYARGASNFSTNWANRASLSYDYYENVF